MKLIDDDSLYTDAPPEIEWAMEHGIVVPDFLPPPDQLVMRRPKKKITIMLTDTTIDFFKKVANENDSKYQTLISNVLDYYADHFNEIENIDESGDVVLANKEPATKEDSQISTAA